MASTSPEEAVDTKRPPSTWEPLRIALFRWLWIGSLISNIGIWMQTVGAQWLLVHEPNAATLVSLVQTAQALPVFLLALPAGVLADSFDRRWLLIAVQGFQFVVAGVLAALTAVDAMTPGLLLALTFALGAGAAIQAPAYSAVVPDLVPRPLVHNASVLGSVNVNIARALGPAVAGVIVASVGVAAVFALNAASFLVFGLILLSWRGRPEPRDREPFLPALRAGGRYVQHSPVVRRILLRAAMFIVPANVLWALLALVAEQRLHLGPSGYGIMLGALGAGSILGAVLLPRVQSHLSTNLMVAAAMVLYGVALVVLVVTPVAWVGVVALLPTGVAWVAGLATLNASLQTFLPVWVRARGLAMYQLVHFAATAASALFWGLFADQLGLVATYLVAAALLIIGAVASVVVLPLRDTSLDRTLVTYWPDPRLELDVEEHPGQILVTLAYEIGEQNREEFLSLAPSLRRMRRRTGGTSWHLYVDAADPRCYVEQFTVASWAEHMLQHTARLMGSDRDLELYVRGLAEEPVEVRHFVTAQVPED